MISALVVVVVVSLIHFFLVVNGRHEVVNEMSRNHLPKSKLELFPPPLFNYHYQVDGSKPESIKEIEKEGRHQKD